MLARYLSGALGGVRPSLLRFVNAPNDYEVYISDRRGNYTASALTNAWPPLSPSTHETGELGWDDFVNPTSANGCPNSTQDAGEDLDGLGATGFYTYGQNPTYIMAAGTVYSSLGVGQYGTYSTGSPGNLYGNHGRQQCNYSQSQLHGDLAFHSLANGLCDPRQRST